MGRLDISNLFVDLDISNLLVLFTLNRLGDLVRGLDYHPKICHTVLIEPLPAPACVAPDLAFRHVEILLARSAAFLTAIASTHCALVVLILHWEYEGEKM